MRVMTKWPGTFSPLFLKTEGRRGHLPFSLLYQLFSCPIFPVSSPNQVSPFWFFIVLSYLPFLAQREGQTKLRSSVAFLFSIFFLGPYVPTYSWACLSLTEGSPSPPLPSPCFALSILHHSASRPVSLNCIIPQIIPGNLLSVDSFCT